MFLPLCLCASVHANESLLTFDLGDDSASRSQDVHGVEGLVFADDGLEDAEELCQTFLHHLLKTFQIIWKEERIQKYCESARLSHISIKTLTRLTKA